MSTTTPNSKTAAQKNGTAANATARSKPATSSPNGANKRPAAGTSSGPAPRPAAPAPVAEAPTAVQTKAPTAASRVHKFTSNSIKKGGRVVREAIARREASGATNVHNGDIDTLEDIERALTPAIAEHKRLADMFNKGRVIDEDEVVRYNDLIATLDAIQRYVDEGDLRTEKRGRDYTDAKTIALTHEVGVSLAQVISEQLNQKNAVDQRFKKTNERIDRIDGGRFPWGATFIGLVLGFVSFLVWVSNAHFKESTSVPKFGQFVFTYTVLNGPFGGILLGLLVLCVSIWIGTWFSRPTSRESVTTQDATYEVVRAPALSGKTGTAPTRVLVPTSSPDKK